MNSYTTLSEFVEQQMTKFGIEKMKKFLEATNQIHSRSKDLKNLGSSRNEADRKENIQKCLAGQQLIAFCMRSRVLSFKA